jgi:hypothetical protein
MTFDDILVRWQQTKKRFARRRLDAPCSTVHEYKGSQSGHPSTYAFVRFECKPADEFSLVVTATWPANLTPDYRHLLIDAMSAAIVDVLIAADSPHVGCALTCTEVKWDDVGSSEVAFYRATKEAMTALRDQETWSALTKTTP